MYSQLHPHAISLTRILHNARFPFKLIVCTFYIFLHLLFFIFIFVQVLGSQVDELDGPTFDSVDFINKKFHDEKSLDGLDKAIASYDDEIRQ